MEARLPTRVRIPLEPDDRADRAVAAVLRGLLEVFQANLEGALDGSDSEALHDLRVSVRRSRSVQREFKRVFPTEQLRPFRQGFRWLQRATGQSRDLDVQVSELIAMRGLVPVALQPELDRLRDRLEARRQGVRAEMAARLRSDRALGLISDWRTLLEGLSESPLDDRRDAARPIGWLAGKRIRRVYRRMIRLGRRIGPGSPSEPYHELRKQGKELRYLLELFGTPLFPEEHVKPMIKSLKGLQDVLGQHQDREAQIATLNDLGAQRPADGAAPIDPRVIEVLVESLVADKLTARGAFAARFAAFAQPEQGQIVRRVFR